ncbi:MAG TPA: FG-GAP repeat protein [Vicinamibacterales bacterium]|nr:FG-GAP repeat protein [Vicinamibacterales bacterium]
MRVGLRLAMGVAIVLATGVSLRTAASQAPASSVTVAGAELKQVAYLKGSNIEAGDHFGCGGVLDGHAGYGASLSGDGNTLAIGAPHESGGSKGVNGDQKDNSVYGSGAVYVFTRSGATWAQQAYVKPSNPQMSADFGHVVVLSADGNTMAVSAYWEASKATGVNGDASDESIPQAGAVYMFTRTGTRWTQQAYIKASNTGEAGTEDKFGDGDQFGVSLTLSDDGRTLAVGAISEDGASPGINGNQADNSATSAGAVYVYSRAGTAWTQQAYIKASNPDAGDLFGYSVALNADGNTLAVGSYDEGGSVRGINGAPDNMRRGAGAVYVFTRTGTTWAQQAYVHASNAEAGDSLGVMVALSDDGNTLLTASLDEDCLATGANPQGQGCDNDRAADRSSGAAYIFVRTGTTWTEQAFLKASNSGANDWFGSRSALSGDGNTAALGASLEDSSGRGVGGKQDDDAASESGAVYFFRRTGSTWSQQHYVKSSNSDAYDEFGGSVALSRDGRTLAVSAHGEDGSSHGAGGNQADNGGKEAGAVYVFGN